MRKGMRTVNIWIIIVNYNGTDDTIACVESINRSTAYQSTVTILVIDNGSRYEEKQALYKYCVDRKIWFYVLEENVGFGKANNIGAEYALRKDAQYILFLNNDTCVDSKFIYYIEQNIQNDIIYIPIIYYYDNPNDIWCAGGYISKWKGTSVHYRSIQKHKITFASGCCFMLSKELINTFGGFDDKYFMYYEDTDFSLKIIQNNIQIKLISNAKIYHKVGRSSNKVSGLKAYYLTRNRLYLLLKYKHYFYLIPAIIYFIITRMIIVVVSLARGKSVSIYCNAVCDYWNNKMYKQI